MENVTKAVGDRKEREKWLVLFSTNLILLQDIILFIFPMGGGTVE